MGVGPNVRNILLERALSRGLPGGPGSMRAEVGRLTETRGFAPNPGALRMWSYVPPTRPTHAALVVVLHGCGQTALGFDAGTGWSALAEKRGFAVLFPEQTSANNAQTCFNWFEPRETTRGAGEVASIMTMVERMVVGHDLDRAQVFVAGLSAGGAMAAALLASYPEVFSAGAINAGLPCGAAAGLGEALPAMSRPATRTGRAWGDIVRKGAPGTTRWPRVTIWHGADDRVVVPANATALAQQWSDLHRLDRADVTSEESAALTRWRDATGAVAVELVSLPGMGHGAAITTAPGSLAPGRAGPFLIDRPISSTEQAARFFGLLPPAETQRRADDKVAEPVQVDPIAAMLDGVSAQMKRLFGGRPRG